MSFRHPVNERYHGDGRTANERYADAVAAAVGSWKFIIAQTVIVIVWIALNVAVVALRWDPYPFILLNLAFSTQAAYAAPILQLSGNRQAQKDRDTAEHTFADTELILDRLDTRTQGGLSEILEEIRSLKT